MVKSILGQCNEFNCLSAIVVILVVKVFILLYNPSCKIQVLTLSYQWVRCYLDKTSHNLEFPIRFISSQLK